MRKRLWGMTLLMSATGMAVADGIQLCISPAPAITVIVDTVDDVVADGDGFTSLREAIVLAKANAQCSFQSGGRDLVSFDLPADSVITLTGALVIEDDAVAIVGPGNLTLRSAHVGAPFFSIIRTTVETNILIAGMVLDGEAQPRTQPAIRAGSATELTLDYLVIKNFDGGVAAPGALDADGVLGLTINNSLFLNNRGVHAGRFGGGAVSLAGNEASSETSNFTVFHTTFYGNETPGDRNSGGALMAVLPGNATLSIVASSFAGNQAGENGGAIAQSGGSLAVSSSTFSGNDAANEGGGIYFSGTGMLLAHSTVVGNSAHAGGGVAGPVGATLAALTGTHTILSLNTATDGSDNMFSVVSTLDHSLIDASAGDIKLGPLAFNGGPTPTHLPLVGSVAIDAGDAVAVAVPELDQRGVARVQGGNIDIGAVEMAPGELSAPEWAPNDNSTPRANGGGAAGPLVLLMLVLAGLCRRRACPKVVKRRRQK